MNRFQSRQKSNSDKKLFAENQGSLGNPLGTQNPRLARPAGRPAQAPKSRSHVPQKPYEYKGFCILWFPVPEVLCFPMKMEHLFPKCIKMYFKTIVIYNVFRTRFPTYEKLSFVMGKLHFPQVGICVTKPLCFPMKMEADSAKLLKCTSKLLCFTTFSERNFRLTGNEVFPLEKSTKLVIEIAFWNPFVFQ